MADFDCTISLREYLIIAAHSAFAKGMEEATLQPSMRLAYAWIPAWFADVTGATLYPSGG